MDRPAAHNRRYVMFLGCLVMLTIGMANQTLPAALGSVSSEFGRNLAQSGVMLFLGSFGFIVSTLVSGWLSDRWGQRPFILGGCVVIGIGLALAAWAPGYAVFLTGIFLMGFSSGLLESPASVAVAEAHPERRAQALNIVHVFYNVGAVAGPALLGGILAIGLGWRAGFASCATLAIAALALAYAVLPRKSRHVEATSGNSNTPAIKWGLVLAIASVMFLYVSAELTIASWSAKYLEDAFRTASSRAALAVSGFWFGMGAGRVLYVIIVRRFGYLVPLLASALLAALFAFLAASARGPLWAGAACALAGLSLGGSWPTILGYGAHVNPGRTGTVFGVIAASGAAGAAMTPLLAGWIAEHSAQRVHTAIAVGGVAALLEAGVIVALIVAERRRG